MGGWPVSMLPSTTIFGSVSGNSTVISLEQPLSSANADAMSVKRGIRT